MSKPSRKDKMISLRLTAGEYNALYTLYPSYGARNMTELARLALQRVIGNLPASDAELRTTLRDLDHRLTAVEGQLYFLAGRDKASS